MSAPCSRQTTTPAPHHSVFTGRMPLLPPNQQRQSTEGKFLITPTLLTRGNLILPRASTHLNPALLYTLHRDDMSTIMFQPCLAMMFRECTKYKMYVYMNDKSPLVWRRQWGCKVTSCKNRWLLLKWLLIGKTWDHKVLPATRQSWHSHLTLGLGEWGYFLNKCFYGQIACWIRIKQQNSPPPLFSVGKFEPIFFVHICIIWPPLLPFQYVK